MLSNMLTTTSFDSAGLSGLASIAHPLSEPGHWRLEAHGPRTTPLRTVDIIVRDGGRARVTVDLANSGAVTPGCAEREQILVPTGMFNLSAVNLRGRGFARLFRGSGTDPVWDSRVLEPGDHYACMPLRPGQYLVENLLDNARSSVRVNYPDPSKLAQGIPRACAPVYLKVGRTIAPRKLRIDPGQLLVFAIGARTHLAVTLEVPDDGPPDLAEWRDQRGRQALEAAFGSRRAS